MAQSPEESAAYEGFMREQDPDEQIRLVEDFLLRYPNSELKEYAFQAAMQAYQHKNDYQRVLTYGELTLEENGDNLTALLILASAISEMTNRREADWTERMTEAERYARRAQDVLSRMRRPVGMIETQWAQTKRETEATAHAVLGLIFLMREDFGRAELEFKEAVALAPRPDAVLLYRLGLSYSFLKKYDLALEVLEQAAALGGVKIATADGGSRDLVAEATEFALKARSAADPSVPLPPTTEETPVAEETPVTEEAPATQEAPANVAVP
jgi:tetratricopeptide (TPR) repeat protein